MKKKIAYILAACLTVFVFSFGVSAYADQASPSKEVTGTLVSVADGKVTLKTAEGKEVELSLAGSVWVFEDMHKAALTDLTAGEQLTVILNNKKQAAYIKAEAEVQAETPEASPSASPEATASVSPSATPEATASASPSATPEATPSVSPSATPEATPSVSPSATPEATPSVSPSAAPEATASASPTVAEATYGDLDKLLIKLKSKDIHIDLSQKMTDDGLKSVVKINMKSLGKLHIVGESAEELIEMLTAGIDLKSPDLQEELVGKITSELSLSADEFDANIHVWFNTGEEVSPAPSTVPVSSESPSAAPSQSPSAAPSESPSATPSVTPSASPSVAPTETPDVDDEDADEQEGKENEHEGRDQQKWEQKRAEINEKHQLKREEIEKKQEAVKQKVEEKKQEVREKVEQKREGKNEGERESKVHIEVKNDKHEE